MLCCCKEVQYEYLNVVFLEEDTVLECRVFAGMYFVCMLCCIRETECLTVVSFQGHNVYV